MDNMMPASENEFIKDFVERTKDNYRRLESGPYEVTQLLNSSLGLLIIPQQKMFNRIADGMISDELYRKLSATIKKNTYKRPLNLSQLARHLRNSIAHAAIEFKAEKHPIKGKPLIIHSVYFIDINTRTKNRVEMDVPVDLLKEFFFAFSEAAMNLK